jgi:hypothetical protein
MKLHSDANTQPARSPKAETRRPKEFRSPKSESIPPVLADAPESVRVSAFGLLSGFGLRPSDFALSSRSSHGYMLTEALVYIGLVFVLLGIGYVAMYRCIDSSVALRRNADDILGAVHAGERWRADIRLAERGVRWDQTGEPFLRLQGATNVVDYRFAGGSVFRREDAGQWSKLLDHVESSMMERDARPTVTVWRWELELQAKAHGSFKPGRVQPLFTFIAVPAGSGSHEN